MLTIEENELLCRVEGDAPMGQLMRRHWMPACLIEEVAERGARRCACVFGEDLVVFRDTDGRLGVIDEYCPHRRASLVLGRNEECGLRCLYHGWKMDVEGNVIEMASEPARSACGGRSSTRRTRRTRGAASSGCTWVRRRRCRRSSRRRGRRHRRHARQHREDAASCNWAQMLEGAIDSAHSSSLHSSDMVPAPVRRRDGHRQAWLRPSTDKAPRMQVQRTNYGFRYAAIRRPIQNAGHARLRAHHDVRRAVHRADSAEQPVQRCQSSTCRWTTRTRRSTSSPGASADQASSRKRGANSARRAWASTSTRPTAAAHVDNHFCRIARR